MAAADAALSVLEAEPWRVDALRSNTAFFTDELSRRGIGVRTDSAIVPILVGDERRAMHAAECLLSCGFLIPAIRHPTVPRGKARLRAAMMCSHSKEDLARAAAVVAESLSACSTGR